jgi:hypothetical protein
MYVSFKFRKPNGLVTPRGPNFAWAQTITTTIDGTRIRFKVPRHRPERANHEQLRLASDYRLGDMYFRSNYEEAICVSDNWEDFKLFHRSPNWRCILIWLSR